METEPCVRVDARAAEAGEVLDRRGHAAGAPAAHGGGDGARGGRRRGAQRAAGDHRARHRRHVGHGSEADVDAEPAQRGCARVSLGAGGRSLRRGGVRRRHPVDDADRAALLVDGHERPGPAGAPQRARERSQLTGARDVVVEEDRPARPPGSQRAAHVGRYARAVEAQDDQAPDLAGQRLLRGPTALAGARLRPAAARGGARRRPATAPLGARRGRCRGARLRVAAGGGAQDRAAHERQPRGPRHRHPPPPNRPPSPRLHGLAR